MQWLELKVRMASIPGVAGAYAELCSRFSVVTYERNEEARLLRLYFADIGEAEPMSREQEAALSARIKQGDLDARDKLVQANLRFVVGVAGTYQYRGLSRWRGAADTAADRRPDVCDPREGAPVAERRAHQAPRSGPLRSPDAAELRGERVRITGTRTTGRPAQAILARQG